MIDRYKLSDESAHRRAHDVRRTDAKSVEEPGGAPGHIVELVGRLGVPAEGRGNVRVPGLVDQGRQAGVAIVEADDLETSPGQLLAERVLPGGHLRPKTSNEQQRWRCGITKSLV